MHYDFIFSFYYHFRGMGGMFNGNQFTYVFFILSWMSLYDFVIRLLLVSFTLFLPLNLWSRYMAVPFDSSRDMRHVGQAL